MRRIELIYRRDTAASSLAAFGGQSASGASGALELVADARLDNRADILAGLGLTGGEGAILTDGALILAAYERWGENCPARLLGDFAFALWDARRHRIFCARDHAGIRQLSYYSDGRVFACASAPEQLLDIPGIPAEPDHLTLARWLLDRFPDPDVTLYRGIRRLPPGHFLIASAAGVELRRYWDAADAAPLRHRSDIDAIDQFRETFASAVACRVWNGGPVAATLSGGLDSSAIVCMARRVAPDALPRAYSLVFDTLPCDERRYIDEVSRASGVAVEFVSADDAGLRLDPDAAQPFPGVPCDATFSMNFPMLERARSQGVRTLLWGFGGDEMLSSGDAYLADFVRRRRFRAAAEAVCDRVRYGGPMEIPRSAAALARPLVPGPLKAAVRLLRPRPGRPRWVRPEFLRDSGALEPVSEPPPRFGCEAQERIYRSLGAGRTAALTLPAADALASAFDMEFRHPFLDRRLIEFVLGLPAARAEIFAGKLLLREALPGILPEIIRRRLDKADFGPVLERTFRGENDIIGSLIRRSELALLGAVDRNLLEKVFQQYLRHPSVAGEDAIASFLRVEMWFRGFHQRGGSHHGELRSHAVEPAEQEDLFGASPSLLR
jgi:asparagine synthase (glutamine-hydrolysing)